MNQPIACTTMNELTRWIQEEALVVIDFWAPWCGPCKAMNPVLDQWAQQHPTVKVLKVDIDQAPEIATSYAISSIPTLVLCVKGKSIDRRVGGQTLQGLTDWVAPHSKIL